MNFSHAEGVGDGLLMEEGRGKTFMMEEGRGKTFMMEEVRRKREDVPLGSGREMLSSC